MTTRLRFAPSPTGYLHLGGARTALFNWLYARHTGGEFLLRIEDTDLERSTDESREAILDGMKWLGLDYDEPFVLQSGRRDEHVRLANKLIEEGKAYKCFCSPEELEEMKEAAKARGENPLYDRRWRDNVDHPTDGRPFTVRFKMPIDGSSTVDDMVLGEVTVSHTEMDDWVILRSDGSPTYNFVVVCDDAFMRVSHVVRGQDHVINTFRQIHLYDALGYDRPRFAHLPLVDGLSKRKGSASVTSYYDRGFLAEAFTNYIARLGWSHGDEELFSTEELIEKFDLSHVNRSNAKYDEQKLLWVNEQWIRRIPVPELAERLIPFLRKHGWEAEVTPQLITLVEALVPRSSTLVEMAAQCRWLYEAPSEYDPKAKKKWLKAGSKAAFEDFVGRVAALDDYDEASLQKAFEAVLAEHELKMGKLAQPVRIAVTGSSVSPGIYETLLALTHDDAVARLKAVIAEFPTPA